MHCVLMFRENEQEQAELLHQLDRCWSDLKEFLSAIYHDDAVVPPTSTNEDSDIEDEKIKELVSM